MTNENWSPKKGKSERPEKLWSKLLTPVEQVEFERCDAIIKSATDNRTIVALKTVRDQRLYKSSFKTFDAYCKSRSQEKRKVDRLIAFYDVCQILGPIGPKPSLESQVRCLTGPELSPETVIEIWLKAVESANGKPVIANIVKAAKDKVIPPPPVKKTEKYPPTKVYNAFVALNTYEQAYAYDLIQKHRKTHRHLSQVEFEKMKNSEINTYETSKGPVTLVRTYEPGEYDPKIESPLVEFKNETGLFRLYRSDFDNKIANGEYVAVSQ
jgi:hypothetical protein